MLSVGAEDTVEGLCGRSIGKRTWGGNNKRIGAKIRHPIERNAEVLTVTMPTLDSGASFSPVYSPTFDMLMEERREEMDN